MTAVSDLPVAPPLRGSTLGRAVLVPVAAVAVAVSARVSLPLAPVPVTAQTLAVLLVGALLGPRRGALSILTYLLAGIAGLPVFAGGGGPAYLLGPTGGYLIGFLPAAFVTGTLIERGWDRRGRTTLAALLMGNAIIFAFGLAWLALYMPAGRALLAAGLLKFLPGEAVKIAAAGAVLMARRGPTHA